MVKVASYRKMMSYGYLEREQAPPVHKDAELWARYIKLAIKHHLESRLANNPMWRSLVPAEGDIIMIDAVDSLANSVLFKEALIHIESEPMYVFIRDWHVPSSKCVLFQVRWDPDIGRFRYV